MKIKKDRDLDTPLNVIPGDRVQLVYTLGNVESILLEETMVESMVINYLAIVDLDDDELQQLGLAQALAGVFGHKKQE